MANPNIVAVTDIKGGNYGWNLSATATTTLLTVDAEKILKINRITVANVDGTNAADVSLYVDGLTTAGATGLSATAAVGAISPTEQTMGLTGVSATSAVGAIVPADQTMGLTGVSATVTLSPIGVAPIGWGRVTAAQTGNYSKTTATQTGNWTKITKGD